MPLSLYTIKLSIIIVIFIVTLKFTINLIEVKLYGYVGAFPSVIHNKTEYNYSYIYSYFKIYNISSFKFQMNNGRECPFRYTQ